MKRLHLPNNKFRGPLPTSLQSPKLFKMKLEGNRFTGPIPKSTPKILKVFNVANNTEFTNANLKVFMGNLEVIYWFFEVDKTSICTEGILFLSLKSWTSKIFQGFMCTLKVLDVPFPFPF